MLSEFIERTGFEPTADEYAKIEEAYYNFDGDKNAFCKAFLSENGVSRICRARADEISRLQGVIQYISQKGDAEYERNLFHVAL